MIYNRQYTWTDRQKDTDSLIDSLQMYTDNHIYRKTVRYAARQIQTNRLIDRQLDIQLDSQIYINKI